MNSYILEPIVDVQKGVMVLVWKCEEAETVDRMVNRTK
jgi:hypothetical protein